MTEATRQALAILREPGTFQWYVIPLLAIAVYVYAVEVERKNWNLVFAGLAFWGMDWFNEIWNALVLHASGRSAVWTAPGRTAYLILVGLNIEICFMFAISGIVWGKLLPKDPTLRILGMPNRWFLAIANSIFCVIVEMVLNGADALIWEYSWWGRGAPWLIFLLGYFPFFVVSYWVHDMKTVAAKVRTVSVIYGVNLAAVLVFGVALRWI
ncbi:MAG: hypothetical protein U0610_00045 [bacterium]